MVVEARDPVSNKNDMIIDVISDIICIEMGDFLGEELPYKEQVDCRVRLSKLHDLIGVYNDIVN